MEVQKQIRENTQELHDFIRDLNDWEQIVKNKDNQLKTRSKTERKQIPPVRGKAKVVAASKESKEPETAAKHTYDYFRDKWDKFDVEAALKEAALKEADETGDQVEPEATQGKDNEVASGTPQIFASEYANDSTTSMQLGSDSLPDAASEKELGNQYFKQKKYVQAIECYSRSIALVPTAVAYANRAMALLKIRRYEDAEMDCSEAIALDDRYTKAYARRGTARRERNKLLGAVEDFEFALRLEPQNKELQQQYQEAKELYEKKNPYRPAEKMVTLNVQKPSLKNLDEQDVRRSTASPVPETSEKMVIEKKQEISQAAARAAATAMSAVAQHMVAPKTSYEFETLWRGFGQDYGAKSRLIKVMDPESLPKVFKDSLSAALMVDIIRTLETLLEEGADASFAIRVLENITKVGRFSMTIMFLSQNDRSVIQKLFDRISSAENMAMQDVEKLEVLRKCYKV